MLAQLGTESCRCTSVTDHCDSGDPRVLVRGATIGSARDSGDRGTIPGANDPDVDEAKVPRHAGTGDPMRVLIVVASNSRRGAELEGSQLASELRERSVEADAIALARGVSRDSIDVPVLGDRPLGLSTLRALRARASDADVVVAYGSTTLPACAIGLVGTRTPFVYRSIGAPGAWLRGRVHRWRTGVMLRRAEKVVALWPQAATALNELYGLPPRSVHAIPNARSGDDFTPADAARRSAARARFGLACDALVVGCVGAFPDEKRLGLALAAVHELDDAIALVVGDGPNRREYERLGAESLGDRAVFTGMLDSVVDAYDAMDVLLLTSRTEGMPGVLIEAALSGVPVVATDVGGVGWLLQHGAVGEAVAPDSRPSDIAAAVRRVAALDPTARDDVVGECTWGVVAAQWVEVLDAVVSPAAVAPRRPTR
jgi:glycosyltransferase involved in cell wall biosynthesis